MFNMISCEWKKLRRSKAFYAMILAAAGMGALSAVMILRNAGGILDGQEQLRYGWFAFRNVIGDIGTDWVLGSIFAGIFICSDFENRTIQAAVTCGHSRMEVLGGKLLICFLCSAVMALPSPIINFAVLAAKNGAGIQMTGNVILIMIRMMCLKILLNWALIGFTIAIAFISRKFSVTIAAVILCIFLMPTILVIASEYQGAVLGNIFEMTPFLQFQAAADESLTFTGLLQCVSAGIGGIILTAGITYLNFRKKELN